MTWDPTAYCPGGTGKKIKHCMCRDISGELQKISHALEGNQRIAALARIDRLLATKANRPCLFSLKISTLLAMEDLQRLEETVATFVKVAPENPLAHSFAAMLEARKDQPQAAVEALQRACYWARGAFPGELLEAAHEVGVLLAEHGQLMAARAHLMLCAVVETADEEAMGNLARTCQIEVPTLLKRMPSFVPPPGHMSCKKRFEAAYRQCIRGAWKVGLELFEALDQEYPGQAAILENIAVTRGCLGYEGCAEAWHRCAAVKSMDFQGAVEAEAVAQLLDFDANRRSVAVKRISINVTDANALQEKLLSSERIVPGSKDPALQPRNSPPPKGLFGLVDRPVPGEGQELTLENVPRFLAHVVLFGKETDREARVELLAEGEGLDLTRQFFAALAHELLVSDSEVEEIVETLPAETVELFPTLQYPPWARGAERKRLHDESVSAAFQEKWPTLCLTELDGKAPRDVADDSAYQVPLAAALLVLEELAETQRWPVNVDQLRETLGVPLPEPIDPTECDIFTCDPHQWQRVEVEKLTDEQLERLYADAMLYSARTATRRLGHELLRRGGGGGLDLAQVTGTVAKLEPDFDVALRLLQQAQALEQKAGQSPARWYLAELPLRLLRSDAAEIGQLLQVIQTRHINEPGVAQSLHGILKRFGIITEDGELADPTKQSTASEPAAGKPDQKLWTPDSAEASSDSEQTSELWIPDTD